MSHQSSESLDLAFRDLISPEIEYLIGVSGGCDSVALLHWLFEQGATKLIVCHFNHGIRGEDADGDEAFVRRLAAELEVDFISAKNDSRVFAKQSRQSLETAARESRYRFFARIARQRHCQRVVLAHHGNDQAETVLMNLFRGSGLQGLRGMKPVSQRKIDGVPLQIIRPFLKVSQSAIYSYQRDRGFEFREDATNSELIAVRNRVRHELIPLANEIFQRDTTGALLRVAEIASMEHAASQLRAQRWLQSHEIRDRCSLPVKDLRQLPPADLNQVIHLWLSERAIGDCGLKEVQSISDMVRSSGIPAKVNLPGNRHARRRAGELFVEDEH